MFKLKQWKVHTLKRLHICLIFPVPHGKVCFACLLLWVLPNILLAQIENLPLTQDSTANPRTENSPPATRFVDTLPQSAINIEAGKLNSAWDFKTDIAYSLNTNFGLWQLRNTYTGTAITSISNSFRDIEDFLLRYSIPIYKKLRLISETKANIMSDRNSLTENKLQRISEQIGFTGNLFDTISAKVLYGLQSNIQSNIKAVGHLVNFDLMLPQYDIDGYMLNSAIITEWLFLEDARKTNDIDITAGVLKQYSVTENINFNMQYKQQRRNFLQSLSTTVPGNISTYSIETNTEKHIVGNLLGRWSPFKNAVLNLDLSVENIDISRNYLYEIANNNNSKVARNFVEWNTTLRLNAAIRQKTLTHNLGLNLFDKNESNNISKKYEINNAEFASLQLIEAQKDNTTLNVNMFYFGQWNINQTNAIKAAFALTKVEYNTPSRLNQDERDELNNLFSLEYVKQMSPILSFSSKLYYSQKHLVFIYKERSSQNNWNRILSFSNGVIVSSDNFYYNPQFEVMANYTAYDFEAQMNRVRSYSIRYLIYKDSLRLSLWRDYRLEGRTNFRLYEQARLYWGTFAELPLQRSVEVSSTIMLFNSISRNISAGIGAKFYNLTYGQLNKNDVIVNPNTTFSYAPAVSVKGSYSRIEFLGDFWLENRRQNNNVSQWMPNMYLRINYILP